MLCLALGPGDHKAKRPDPLARIFNHRDLLEGLLRLLECHFEDVFEKAVEVPHDRHLVEEPFTETDEKPADKVPRHNPEKRQEHHSEKNTNPWDIEL